MRGRSGERRLRALARLAQVQEPGSASGETRGRGRVGLNPSGGASMANDEHVAMLKKGVRAWKAWRNENPDICPDLGRAHLSYANLSEADLIGADLSWANLSEADLIGANLGRANLSGADLIGANLTDAILRQTVFENVTLTRVKGLDHCEHSGPSALDFQTLQKSGPLPAEFLRGVGLPERLIEHLSSLLNEAIQHYSCFISYSSKDRAFAERLHADLQNKGVRCWFAPHDMPIGAKIIDAIDEAMRERDKVLLILSEGAIASDWVEGEVTRALDEERTRKQAVLFPVRIDDAVMQTSESWARLLRGQRNVGDFSRWKEHDSYQKSFERLMRDLRVEKSGQ